METTSARTLGAMGVGAALLVWMAVEIAIVGYSNNPPLQPFYIVLGLVITGVGVGWQVASGIPPLTPQD